jgi:serine/threonine-protein kinase
LAVAAAGLLACGSDERTGNPPPADGAVHAGGGTDAGAGGLVPMAPYTGGAQGPGGAPMAPFRGGAPMIIAPMPFPGTGGTSTGGAPPSAGGSSSGGAPMFPPFGSGGAPMPFPWQGGAGGVIAPMPPPPPMPAPLPALPSRNRS